jgi:hypothetical protein
MPAYQENSRQASGSVTAPGAGAAIASIAALPPGVYEVRVHATLTGTAETALQNLRLRENGNTLYTLPSLSTFALTWIFPRVEVNEGGGNLDLIAIAAATAGAIYNATLIATRIG